MSKFTRRSAVEISQALKNLIQPNATTDSNFRIWKHNNLRKVDPIVDEVIAAEEPLTELLNTEEAEMWNRLASQDKNLAKQTYPELNDRIRLLRETIDREAVDVEVPRPEFQSILDDGSRAQFNDCNSYSYDILHRHGLIEYPEVAEERDDASNS